MLAYTYDLNLLTEIRGSSTHIC
uniref:Uncharacterized protein n=1 Tax=Arundo donax TaxID=35708 RepID=A0A0A9B3K7_ARUDO